MLKVGIVGLGGISKVHLAGWKNIEGAEITAVCDIREERFEGHSDKRCYTSYDEMLEKEEFDIVDVCVPTYLHIEFSLKAINKGINVICEKPISLNPADVNKVYEAAEKKRRKVYGGNGNPFYATVYVRQRGCSKGNLRQASFGHNVENRLCSYLEL